MYCASSACFCCDESLELGLALIHGSAGGRGLGILQIVCLLGNHRLEKGHILLLAVQRLRHGVKLSCECLKRVRVGLLLLGEPAEILLLEGRELGILLVKVLL